MNPFTALKNFSPFHFTPFHSTPLHFTSLSSPTLSTLHFTWLCYSYLQLTSLHFLSPSLPLTIIITNNNNKVPLLSNWTKCKDSHVYTEIFYYTWQNNNTRWQVLLPESIKIVFIHMIQVAVSKTTVPFRRARRQPLQHIGVLCCLQDRRDCDTDDRYSSVKTSLLENRFLLLHVPTFRAFVAR